MMKGKVYRMRRGLYTFCVTILLLFCWSVSANAAESKIIPLQAVLYTGEGAEVFAQPNTVSFVTSFPGNIPVQVTGQTENGFFQVMVSGTPYYIYSGALSMQQNTRAYKLTSIDAKAALVGDATTGQLLYAQNPLTRLAPASTTKIMTTLLTLEAIAQGRLSLDTPVVVSASALAGVPNDASHVSPRLQVGEVMNVLSLLECTMIKSDCHACNVLAEAVAGSVDQFVALMNAKAVALGCVDTHFVNTSGYPAPDHYTNAFSLFLIAQEAMKYDTYRTIIMIPSIEIPATNLSAARRIDSTNELIKAGSYYNPYAIGGKTGSSSSSGLCLVNAAIKDNKYVISVILGASNSVMSNGVKERQQFSETNKLLNLALAN